VEDEAPVDPIGHLHPRKAGTDLAPVQALKFGGLRPASDKGQCDRGGSGFH